MPALTICLMVWSVEQETFEILNFQTTTTGQKVVSPDAKFNNSFHFVPCLSVRFSPGKKFEKYGG